MELKDRTFKDNKTGQTIKIVDSFKNIAVTSGGDRIDANRLLDVNHYTEELDPDRFLKNESTYNAFSEAIKSIDLNNIPDDDSVHDVQVGSVDPAFQPPTNESAVIQYDEEVEREQLAKKYGLDMDKGAVNQQQAQFDEILNGGDSGEKIPVVQKGNVRQEPKNTEKEFVQPNYTDVKPKPQPTIEDPIITMFKNVKRKENFTLSIEIDDKIPRLDFIEMMEDSYETSIIEFLADDMLGKMLSDPKVLRNKIIQEITDLVYPDGKPVEEVEEAIEEEDVPEDVQGTDQEVVVEEVIEGTDGSDEPEEVVVEDEDISETGKEVVEKEENEIVEEAKEKEIEENDK